MLERLTDTTLIAISFVQATQFRINYEALERKNKSTFTS